MAKSLEDYTPDELVAHARDLEQKNSLFNVLMSDPDTREKTLLLVKSKKPEMSIPEIDVKRAQESALAKEREEREKLDRRLLESEARERIRSERERVKAQYDLDDADVAEVEKIMTDKDAPVPHYDGAVKVYRAQRAQATPTSSQLQVRTYDMPAKDVWGKGVGNKMGLDKVFKEQAYAALIEMRGGKAA